MHDLIFVINYISDRHKGFRYWANGLGSHFFGSLEERGIGHAVYACGDIDLADIDYVRTGVSYPTTIAEVGSLVRRALEHHRTIFFISDSPEAISSLEGIADCLPFLLIDEATPTLQGNNHIEIGSLSMLDAYFTDSLPHHLLIMLGRRPGDYRAEIDRRNNRIMEQIRVAGGTYILGTGSNGKLVYEECARTKIKVLGFTDNNITRQGTRFFDLPVVAPTALDPAHDTIIIASGNYSWDIFQQLQHLGVQYVQNLAEFFFATDSFSQLGIFFHDDLWQNRIRYHALYLLLADSESRSVLDSLVGFHQGFDLSLPGRVCDSRNPQWFDSTFFRPSRDHVFVDGGAFDGDTAMRFIQLNGPQYKAVHLFEPDSNLYRKAVQNLSAYQRIHIHNMGLSDKRGTLSFVQTGLTDGRFVSGPGIPIPIDAIDNTVDDSITYLKLDVEGAELDALAGAATHLRNDLPVIAIAVYHKPHDIWAVPRRILDHNPNYTIYLRHYTQFAYETVLYAVPGPSPVREMGFA